MKTLYRYIAAEAIKIFIIAEAAFVGIYLFAAFFDKLDNFIEHSAAAVDVVAYMSFKIPSIFLEVTPAAVLLASTMIIALLSKYNELLAMKVSGMSLFDIYKPLLFTAFLASSVMFLVQEFVAPAANIKTKEIYRVKIEKKEPSGSAGESEIWYRGRDNQIWNVEYVDSSTFSLIGPSIYIFGPGNRLISRIDADQAQWNGYGWILKNGTSRQFDDENSFNEEFFDEIYFPSSVRPDELKEIQKDPEDMSLREVIRHREKLRRQGLNDQDYLLEMHFKISRSAIPFLMSLIAIPFAARRRIKSALAQGFGFTIAVSFIYYVLMSLGLALGKGGHLPAPLAAWEANIIFASVSIYLLIGVRKEPR